MITQERLKEVLHYDPNTGIFTWLTSTSNSHKIGDVAGGITHSGYYRISISNKLYYAHRLAWLYMYGELPKGSIDHINRATGDNRIENLRDVDHKINMKNTKRREDNTSGATGVRLHKRSGKWTARIYVNGKEIHLGYYTDKAKAIAKRRMAEVIYGFHANHGRDIA